MILIMLASRAMAASYLDYYSRRTVGDGQIWTSPVAQEQMVSNGLYIRNDIGPVEIAQPRLQNSTVELLPPFYEEILTGLITLHRATIDLCSRFKITAIPIRNNGTEDQLGGICPDPTPLYPFKWTSNVTRYHDIQVAAAFKRAKEQGAPLQLHFDDRTKPKALPIDWNTNCCHYFVCDDKTGPCTAATYLKGRHRDMFQITKEQAAEQTFTFGLHQITWIRKKDTITNQNTPPWLIICAAQTQQVRHQCEIDLAYQANTFKELPFKIVKLPKIPKEVMNHIYQMDINKREIMTGIIGGVALLTAFGAIITNLVTTQGMKRNQFMFKWECKRRCYTTRRA